MSLIVVINHLFPSFLMSPGQLEHVGAGWLIDVFRWSPLGVAMDGMQAVYVFFTISGVVLTHPILRAQRPHRTLAGMAAYRYPRLMVPILASGLIAWGLLATGNMMNIEAARLNAAPGWYATIYSFPANIAAMLKFSLWDVFGYVPAQASWNNVLWTMPVELLGSFMLFGLLAFVRWRWLRLVLICGPGMYWTLTVNNGYYTGFLLGSLLAELLVAAERSETVHRRLVAASPVGWLCLTAALGLSMHVQTVAFAQQRDAFSNEQNLIAFLTVIGIILAGPARTWMSNRPSQFLGRISFALYLIHLPLICSFSCALFIMTVDVMPYWAVVLLISALTFAAAFIVAFVFAIFVEEHLLRWLKLVMLGMVNPAFDFTVDYLHNLAIRRRI